jgi:hypothetical protein
LRLLRLLLRRLRLLRLLLLRLLLHHLNVDLLRLRLRLRLLLLHHLHLLHLLQSAIPPSQTRGRAARRQCHTRPPAPTWRRNAKF